ncbi:HET-domain-containing protein [Dothidotthia symphoricarpi CBS 119687]|uniref:HET-domain-containing protein n=1 Tax=Dothidotthia symphoricarpi CBS 119687 TaxID=1392245 RepID=A0A6A5ZXA6_9PLEO|nr:HET-domain-containing protein [Dothidotthia symphoricarpi CBS 119687]KAF2123916.1 HET-domain-containing protein [Dothidotthia symphoricarpi CBS 119687]
MSLQQQDDRLCEFCANLNLSVQCFLGSSITSQNHGASFHRIILPRSDVMLGHSCCPFCRLLVSALIESNPGNLETRVLLENGVVCALEWIKDGRTLNDYTIDTRSTRRLRLFTTDNSLSDAHLVLLNPGLSNAQFLGRRVDPSIVDMERVSSWIDACREGHGFDCQPCQSTPTKELYLSSHFRAIDVDAQYITTDVQGHYVALSYVWGGKAGHATTSSNVDDLSRPGGLQKVSSHVSSTVRDAMELTRLLGHKYLWVDRYCIIQDSIDDKRETIGVMDAIYTGAVLTICAANGDAGSGIPGIIRDDRKFSQTIGNYDDDVQLMVSQSAEFYINRSTWNSRAWTFQERLCSNRCLIIVDGRVCFQCRQSAMCEDIHMESNSSYGGANGWSLELKDVPGRLFSENPLRQYTKSVQLYTERRLSFVYDKLPAFSAIQKLLSVNLKSDFVVALPTSYFDFALLWTPKTSLRRISSYPSWSWCGWENAIEYRYETLEGVLMNLHEWLTSHTWIIWYVQREGRRAELVWNGNHQGTAGRWQGYERGYQSNPYGHFQTGDPLPTQPRSEPVLHRLGLSGPLDKYPSDMTLYLRFYTHSAFFRLDTPAARGDEDTDTVSGLSWCSLSDAEGDWCGTVLLENEWTQAGDGPYEFIAISEARDFSTEEHDSWNFYVPRDRVDSQWDLYYVLLIQTFPNGISERVGLGKVFKDAFEKSLQPGYSWKEISLG